ncbi:MAG TPA: DUF1743 domain-containing protein [Thermoplasmata archaeon]|nr:DUF1743 domain-containing protein [Thermoplasmata archaeon]
MAGSPSSAPVWLGMDDTDSPRGGCTTFTLTEVVRAAHELGLDLLGEPRLVRLNPNVPFKTRGNAALAARFGLGRGPRRRQGVGPAGPIWSYARGRGPAPELRRRFIDRAWEVVRKSSRLGEEGTDPALVASERALPSSLYRAAVSRLVDRSSVEHLLLAAGAVVHAEGSRQGLVGAAAALAWPAGRSTWELISYRPAGRWGERRTLDAESVRTAQRRYSDLFLCHDARTRRLLVAPHTTCPILFGLRSLHRAALSPAFGHVRSEPVERWMIFRTNQGTGDHLVKREVMDLQPFDSARLRGVVTAAPRTLEGGHVRWPIVGRDGGIVECIAFEPTKILPRVAEDLVAGDRVEVWGGRGSDPIFRVEGLRLLARAAYGGRPRAPRCDACGRPTRSLGRLRGFRCPGCRARYPPERGEWRRETRFPIGTYHPTPSARRHLAPLGPETQASAAHGRLLA